MGKILFSILIPVFNAEKYLSRCLESVMNQSYESFEVVLVDDGSTDTSGLLCDQYAAEDERIHAFHTVNMGQLHARETAIRNAKGDYFVFLDSDDTLHIEALKVLFDTIEETDADCVVYGMDYIQENHVQKTMTEYHRFVLTDKRNIYRKIFLEGDYNSLCRKAFRAACFSQFDYSQFYSLRHGEDLLHSIDALKNCRSIAFIPDVLYSYYANPSSVTNSSANKTYSVNFTVREFVLDFLLNEKVFGNDDINEYRGYCIYILMAQLLTVCSMPASLHDNVKAFACIRREAFYQRFLANGTADLKKYGLFSRIEYYMFRRKKDCLLALGLRVLLWCNKIIKQIKPART